MRFHCGCCTTLLFHDRDFVFVSFVCAALYMHEHILLFCFLHHVVYSWSDFLSFLHRVIHAWSDVVFLSCCFAPRCGFTTRVLFHTCMWLHFGCLFAQRCTVCCFWEWLGFFFLSSVVVSWPGFLSDCRFSYFDYVLFVVSWLAFPKMTRGWVGVLMRRRRGRKDD